MGPDLLMSIVSSLELLAYEIALYSACFNVTSWKGGKRSLLTIVVFICSWTAITQLAHHGMLFVPIGYTFGAGMFKMDSIRGGTPYGAGVFAGDGTREASETELALAEHQGKYMAAVVKKLQGWWNCLKILCLYPNQNIHYIFSLIDWFHLHFIGFCSSHHLIGHEDACYLEYIYYIIYNPLLHALALTPLVSIFAYSTFPCQPLFLCKSLYMVLISLS